MALQVNATRMELLRLRRRLMIARRGHQLLKDKQEQLIQLFFDLLAEIQSVESELCENLLKIYTLSTSLRATTHLAFFNKLISFYIIHPKINIEVKHHFGIPWQSVKEISYEEVVRRTNIDFTPSDYSIIISLLKKTFLSLLSMAFHQKMLFMLSREIERTRRRVNALEYIFIPELTETIKFITFKLEENMRNDILRLMKIKDIIREH
jgi:V/A-type H+-transporting ATPase subunit D